MSTEKIGFLCHADHCQLCLPFNLYSLQYDCLILVCSAFHGKRWEDLKHFQKIENWKQRSNSIWRQRLSSPFWSSQSYTRTFLFLTDIESLLPNICWYLRARSWPSSWSCQKWTLIKNQLEKIPTSKVHGGQKWKPDYQVQSVYSILRSEWAPRRNSWGK